MADISNLIQVGRLIHDAEAKETRGGKTLVTFTIASNTNRRTKDGWEDYANFYDVESWTKRAAALVPYLKKGNQVIVKGELKQDRWTSPEGQKRSKVVILCQDLQLGRIARANQDFGDPPPDKGNLDAVSAAFVSDDPSAKPGEIAF